MSHFYGTMKGSRGESTRCGTKSSGLTTIAASGNGAVEVTLYVDAQGRDCFRVQQRTWKGAGIAEVIAEGVVGKSINTPKSFTPILGACSCRPGVERDNCPACEGTGQRIDFAAIRARK